MELCDLAGNHKLSGVEYTTTSTSDSEEFMSIIFILDGVAYRAEEDPDDGYRSYMKELVVLSDEEAEKLCKNRFEPEEVVCEYDEGDEDEANDILYINNSITGEAILELGTSNTNDYYPCCVMNYKPEFMQCNGRKHKLLPCPFCGGEARQMDMGYPHWVFCTQCGARIHGRVVGEIDGVKASADAWNKRDGALMEKLSRLNDILNVAKTPFQSVEPRCGMGYEYHDWHCPNCRRFLAYEPAWDKLPKRCPECGQKLKPPIMNADELKG